MSSTSLSSFYKYMMNGEGLYMLLAKYGLKNHDSDETYIKHVFKAHMGKDLNISNPETFNEKIQWLKIYDRNPVYNLMVDKFEAKKYVSNIIGEKHIIPTYGVWDSFSDIHFEDLPNRFVLKCTHDSNSVVICKNKDSFDYKRAKVLLENRLKMNHFWKGREWAYKDVKPRIIAEELLVDPCNSTLTDYKIFCFNGVPEVIMTAIGSRENEGGIIRRMYDTNWNLLPVGLHGKEPVKEGEITPSHLSTMIDISKKLSVDIPLVRVDLYVIGEKVLFGELTLYHSCGFEEFVPKEWDLHFGKMIRLQDV